MSSTIDSVTFDCADPGRLAAFWSAALGYVRGEVDEEGAEILDPSGSGSRLLFLVVPEEKAAKNRVHLDLRPAQSMTKEVGRLHDLGASVLRHVEVEGSSWTVMLDPEGNEFCVLRGPEDGWAADE